VSSHFGVEDEVDPIADCGVDSVWVVREVSTSAHSDVDSHLGEDGRECSASEEDLGQHVEKYDKAKTSSRGGERQPKVRDNLPR
jgi:hypothetical protein